MAGASATAKRAERKGNTVAVAEERMAGIADETAETRARTKLAIPGCQPCVTWSSVMYSNRGAQTRPVFTALYRHPGVRKGRKTIMRTE